MIPQHVRRRCTALSHKDRLEWSSASIVAKYIRTLVGKIQQIEAKLEYI